ncbi:polysaccharide pyruvyl transferase family protein, partial [Serratia sp. CY81166]
LMSGQPVINVVFWRCAVGALVLLAVCGIPAIFLDGESGESMFKYDDYYQGTGRDYYPVAKSVDEAFKLKHAEPIDMNSLVPKLFQAFPYDLWDVTES